MFKTPYCTNEEADEVNAGSAEWLALTEDEKTKALQWGRVFLDANYSCSGLAYIEDEDLDQLDEDFYAALKVANALLGNYYTTGNLFTPSDTGNRVVTEKAVKAGSVSSSKKYSSANSETIYDPYPDVTATLAGYCTRTSSTMSTISVIKG